MSDYAQRQLGAYESDVGMIGTTAPQPPSPLTELSQTSRKQAQDIQDIAGHLNALADRLFGPEPTPVHPPTTQGTGSSLNQIAPPLMPMAEQTQFLVGEAIETLRRAVVRVDRL